MKIKRSKLKDAKKRFKVRLDVLFGMKTEDLIKEYEINFPSFREENANPTYQDRVRSLVLLSLEENLPDEMFQKK